MIQFFKRHFKSVVGESQSIKAGSSALGKLGKFIGIAGDVYLAVWAFDLVKGWLWGATKSEVAKREAFVRTVLDPIVLVALASENRNEIVRNMLTYVGMPYAVRGSDLTRLFGTSLLTASEYMTNTKGFDDTVYSLEDVQAIISDAEKTEINDLLHLEDLSEFLNQEGADELKGYKMVDYFAYFLNNNQNEFPSSFEETGKEFTE
jgi:hypothetical protein